MGIETEISDFAAETVIVSESDQIKTQKNRNREQEPIYQEYPQKMKWIS